MTVVKIENRIIIKIAAARETKARDNLEHQTEDISQQEVTLHY